MNRQRSIRIFVRNKQKYNPALFSTDLQYVDITDFAGTTIRYIKEVCKRNNAAKIDDLYYANEPLADDRSVAHYNLTDGTILETTSNPFWVACINIKMVEVERERASHPHDYGVQKWTHKSHIRKRTILSVLLNSKNEFPRQPQHLPTVEALVDYLKTLGKKGAVMNPLYTQRDLQQMYAEYQQLDVHHIDPLGSFLTRQAARLGFCNTPKPAVPKQGTARQTAPRQAAPSQDARKSSRPTSTQRARRATGSKKTAKQDLICEDCETMTAELYCPDCQGVGEKTGVCLCLTCADKLHSGALKRNHGVKDVSAAPRIPKQYIPHPYRAPFAILIGMYRGLLDTPPVLSMNEGEIKIRAQPFTDTDLQDKQTGRYVGGFDCMENTLMNKGLVQKEAADRHTFALTESGQRLGEQLYSFHTAVTSFMAANNIPTVPVQNINSQCGTRRLYLVIDDKERDVHRLSKLARDHGIPTLIRSLPAGDYVWILSPPLASPHAEYNGNNRSAELLLPFIVERKSWDDYYDSWRGSRFQKQINNMKASGVDNCFYLVEGSVKNLRFVSPDLQQRLKDQLMPLMMEDGFYVNYTSSWSKSAQWLCWMTSLITQAYKEGVFKKQMTFADIQRNITENNRKPSVRHGRTRGKSHVWLSQDLIQCISSTGNDSLKKTCEANFGPTLGSRDPCQLLVVEGLEIYNKQRSGLLIKCCEFVANVPDNKLSDEVSLHLLPQKEKMIHYDVFSYWQLYIQVFFGVYVVRSEDREDTCHIQAAFHQSSSRSGTCDTMVSGAGSCSGASLMVNDSTTRVSLMAGDFAADLQTEECMVQRAIEESMKEIVTYNHGQLHKSNEQKRNPSATIRPIIVVDSQEMDQQVQTTLTKSDDTLSSGKFTTSAQTSPEVIELVDSQEEDVGVPKTRSESLTVCGGSVCDLVILDDSQEDDQIPCANEGYQNSCVILLDSQEESQLQVCNFLSDHKEPQNNTDSSLVLKENCGNSDDSSTLLPEGLKFPCSKTLNDSVLQKECIQSQGSESLPDDSKNKTNPSPLLVKHCYHDGNEVYSITNLPKASKPLSSLKKTDPSSVSEPELDSTGICKTFPISENNKEQVESVTGKYSEPNKLDRADSVFCLPTESRKHYRSVDILSEEEQDRDSQDVGLTCMRQQTDMNVNKVLSRQSSCITDKGFLPLKTPTKRPYAPGHRSPESKIPRLNLGDRDGYVPDHVQSMNSSVCKPLLDTESCITVNSDTVPVQPHALDKSNSPATISDADNLGYGADTLKVEELARRLQQENDDEYGKSKVGNDGTSRLLRSKLGSETQQNKHMSPVVHQSGRHMKESSESDTSAAKCAPISDEELLLNRRNVRKDMALYSLLGKQEFEESSSLSCSGPSRDASSDASVSTLGCPTALTLTSEHTCAQYRTDVCSDSNDCMSVKVESGPIIGEDNTKSDCFAEDMSSEPGVSVFSNLGGNSSRNCDGFVESNSRTVVSHVDSEMTYPTDHSVFSEKSITTDQDAFSGGIEAQDGTETAESVSQDIVESSVKDMGHTENCEIIETSSQCQGQKSIFDYTAKCVVPDDECLTDKHKGQLLEDSSECPSSQISQSVLSELPMDHSDTHKSVSVPQSVGRSHGEIRDQVQSTVKLPDNHEWESNQISQSVRSEVNDHTDTHKSVSVPQSGGRSHGNIRDQVHGANRSPENGVKSDRNPVQMPLDEVKTEAMTDEEFARQLQEQFDKESGRKCVPVVEAMSLRHKRRCDTHDFCWPLDCKVPKTSGICSSLPKESLAKRDQVKCNQTSSAYIRHLNSNFSASKCDTHRFNTSATSLNLMSSSSADMSDLNCQNVYASQRNVMKVKTSRKALFEDCQPADGATERHDSNTLDSDAELARILQEEELQRNMADGGGVSASLIADAAYARTLQLEEQQAVSQSSLQDPFQTKETNVNSLNLVPEQVCSPVFGVGSSSRRNETDDKFDRLPRKPIGRNTTEKSIANQLALYRKMQNERFCGGEKTGSNKSSRSLPEVTPSTYSRSPTASLVHHPYKGTRRVPSASVTSPWQQPPATSPWPQPTGTSATARTPPKACVTPVQRVSVTHQSLSTFKSFHDKATDRKAASGDVHEPKTKEDDDIIDITGAAAEEKQRTVTSSVSPVVKSVRCGNCKELGHPRTHSGCPYFYRQSEVERRQTKASENLKRRVERAKENEEALELLTRSEQILRDRKQTMLAQIRAEAEKVEEEFNDQIRQLNQVVKRREKRKKKTT
ncbi:uncharacterized protein [Haliotis asinina]|uniref:uncharacterized protein n=1 Tax=Haliotis asinina TaxID=109174 RepID=UPI00353247F6